jgi:urease accessory protein
MRRALNLSIRGTWSLAAANAKVTLDHQGRRLQQADLTTDAGEAFTLDLPKPIPMADGDGLRCDDGTFILVRAKAEPCLRLSADRLDAITRIAWRIGRLGAPVQFLVDALVTPNDSAVAELAASLGASVEVVDLPFEPEPIDWL